MYDVYNPADTSEWVRTETNRKNPKGFNGEKVSNADNRDLPYLNARGLFPVSDQRSTPGKWQKATDLERNVVNGLSVWTNTLVDLAGPELDAALDAQKSVVLTAIERNFENATREVRGYYRCDAERETWKTQEEEAAAFLQSASAPTPWMDGFLDANSSMTKADLANVIIDNAEAFKEAAGSLGGQLSAKRAEILTATTKAGVDAVDVNFSLPAVNIEDK